MVEAKMPPVTGLIDVMLRWILLYFWK